MKRKTYRNVLRAIKMIQAKGYSHEESCDIALKIFDQASGSDMPVEWFIEKVMQKTEYDEEYCK